MESERADIRSIEHLDGARWAQAYHLLIHLEVADRGLDEEEEYELRSEVLRTLPDHRLDLLIVDAERRLADDDYCRRFPACPLDFEIARLERRRADHDDDLDDPEALP